MVSLRNVSNAPRDLADDRVLAPGEQADDVEVTAHEQAGIDAGHLLVIEKAGRKRPGKNEQEESE